jgi:membrane-bound lytic murein transglycosylase MltF
MRGDDRRPDTMFSYVAPEHRIPADHPRRAIRAIVDTALRELSPEFARLYAKSGRPSSGNGLPWLVLGALSALLCFVATGALAQQPDQSRGITTRLDGSVKVDFDKLVERRFVRVVVPHSRTLYFNDKGHERGISADFVRDFERYINQKYKKQLGKRPITVIIRPTTRDVLLTNVVEGLADIAVGNLTVTEERLKLVDLVAPGSVEPVSELALSGPKSPPITAAEELSGKTVHVRKSSSYYESLLALNDRLKQAGKPPANLVLVPDALEDEDMMEMLNAGILEAIIVDDWKARMWAQVLPRMKVNHTAVVRTGGQVGWAIRKDSPKLAAILNEFYTTFVKKQGVLEARMAQYHRRIKQLKDPTGSSDRKRFEDTLTLFRKYGEQYRFDPLMLAAQGYQESQLDQNAKSHVGAIGIMQIMPATGKELKVGDIRIAESNVHGGAKYMDRLMTNYLRDATFDETNRTLFAFACYNAGPGNIARMRKEAVKRGLDPDRWFNNVEVVTAEKIGIETTTYVRNIYKYYVAYRLLVDVQEAQEKARATVKPGA